MTTTRGSLRRNIGNQLSDMTALVATATGTTTKLTDTVHLSGAIEAPRNRDIIFTSGTNIGLERRVDAFDTSMGYVTFPAVTAATAVADTAEMYNFRGIGWHLSEYHDAINRAIAAAYPAYKQPYNGTVAAVFDAVTGDITVPATITHVDVLQYQDTASIWQNVPQAHGRAQAGWWVDPYAGTINVRDTRYTGLMSGRPLRLIGYTRPTPLTTEAGTTNIPPEWLINQACAYLCMSALDRNPSNYTRGQLFMQQAKALEPSIITRLSGSTRAVGYA